MSAFYHLAAFTGARRGELLYLRWDHVHLDAAEIRITGSPAAIGGQRTEGTPKGGRSWTVSIDPGTVQALKEHRTRQAAERLAAGTQWRGQASGCVFTTALGEPFYPDAVSRLMLVLVYRYNAQQSPVKAGRPLPLARLHDLRHVHATTLLRGCAGVRRRGPARTR